MIALTPDFRRGLHPARPAPLSEIAAGVPSAGNVGPVLLTESFRELFAASATCAAGLIGLLFVAISVGPHRNHR